MPSGRAEITRARGLEFRISDSRKRAGDSYAFNVVIQLNATVDGRGIVAAGEAAPRGRALTGDTGAGSWRFLQAGLRRLEGVALPVRPANIRADLLALMGELAALAAKTATGRAPTAPYRGMLAGLEAALLDLAAKTAQVSVAELLGGERRPLPVAGVVNMRGPEQTLEKRIAAAGSCPAVKVVALADWEAGLDAARRVASVVGAQMPLWLELDGSLAQADVVKLVEAVAERIVANELPRHVIVQGQGGGLPPGELGAVQAVADGLVPSGDGEPGIVVMADVQSRDEAAAAIDTGVRGVNLNPQRLGGALAALDVADYLQAQAGDVRIGLSTVTHASGLGLRALAELATALPRLDYCAAWPEAADSTVGIDPPLACDDAHRLQAGSGAGIGGTASLVPAVSRLSRYAEAPTAPPRLLTYESLTENTFDLPALTDLARSDGAIELANPLLDRAALLRGLNLTRLARGVMLADHPELPQPIGFASRRTAWTGVSSRAAVDRKDLTKKLLQAAGVTVPRGEMFQSGQADEAVSYAASFGVPVVVKPRAGSHGVGVTTDLRSEADVRTAISALSHTVHARRPFVVEEYITGADYRFLVVGDKVVSVVLRRPASVLGDGVSSVTELVLHKNRRRLENPQMRGSLIELNRNAMYWLRRQGLTVDSVPDDGQHVQLGSAGNVANGGDSVEVLDETHESLLDLAVRATLAIPGLDHAGVDLVGDHRRSLDERPAAIIEVNSNPGTDLNHFPLFGTPRDVSAELVVRQCELGGLRLGPVRDRLSLRIQVEGKVQRVGYRRWFERLANARGVVGSIRNVPTGGVEAVVSGAADEVWVLAAWAIAGPPRAVVHRVTTTHIAELAPADTFEVVS